MRASFFLTGSVSRCGGRGLLTLFSYSREQADKAAAKERYAKLHAAGKVRRLSPSPFHYGC